MKMEYTKQKVKSKTYKGGAKQMTNTGNFSAKPKQPAKCYTYSKVSKKHGV